MGTAFVRYHLDRLRLIASGGLYEFLSATIFRIFVLLQLHDILIFVVGERVAASHFARSFSRGKRR